VANQTSEAEGNSMSAPITLTGQVVADPELKFGQNGNAVLNLRVVTSARRKTDEGWQNVDTTFWRVAAFRQLAENAAESLSKGDGVIVVGKVKSREWSDKDGNKQVSWEVTADNIGLDLRWSASKSAGVSRVKSDGDDPWSKPLMPDNESAPF
jgi:single stranded DNA-binding protein (ssb)